MSARSFTLDKKKQGNIEVIQSENGYTSVLLHGHKVACLMDKHSYNYECILAKNDEDAFEIAKRYANDEGSMIVSVQEEV